jgi:hypothetical protein
MNRIATGVIALVLVTAGWLQATHTPASAELLGYTAYAAGSDSALHTQNSNTMTDMDAANVLVTFTAPSSGNVLIRASVLHGSTSSAGDLYWGLVENTTTVATQYLSHPVGTGITIRMHATFIVTGLTPGHSYTYKLAHRVTADSATAYTGPNYGPALLEVWRLP